MPQQLTIRQAADALGVSMDTVRRRLRSGQLNGTQVAMTGKAGASAFQWLVDVPDDQVGAARPLVGANHPTSTDAQPMALQVVTVERDALREQVADLRAERDQMLAIIQAMAQGKRLAMADMPTPVDTGEGGDHSPAAKGNRVGRAWRVLRGVE